MRQSALNTEIKAALAIEDLEKTKSLFNLGNNLNQITKKMHQQGLGKTAEEVEELIEKIKKILA